MKKSVSTKIYFATALLCSVVIAAPQSIVAQNHVVSPTRIQNDLSSKSSDRKHNEQQLKRYLSSKEMQKVMKSEGVDPQQVANAVSQLSDADLAQLAARSEKAQRDFAAGGIGLGIFTLIGIVVVAVILIGIFV